MMRMGRVLGSVGIICIAALLAGCGALRETLPARSAMEQLVLSTAADRAIEMMPTNQLTCRRVFLDTSNLDCFDKPYVVQRIEKAVLQHGGRLAVSREASDVVLGVASGGLSMDKRDYLLGMPSVPVPIPFASQPLVLPELAIFKTMSYKGKAKLLFTAVDPVTGGQLFEIPMCYGKSQDTYLWVLLFGPFQRTDLPRELK